MADFYLSAGDRLPELEIAFLNEDDTPLDLTGATVTFTLRNAAEAVVIDAAAASVSAPATAGIVTYPWSAADAALPVGDYFGRFTASYGGLPTSLPADRWLHVVIS